MDTQHTADTTHCRLVDRRPFSAPAARLQVLRAHAATAETFWHAALDAYAEFSELPPGRERDAARDTFHQAMTEFHAHIRAAEEVQVDVDGARGVTVPCRGRADAPSEARDVVAVRRGAQSHLMFTGR